MIIGILSATVLVIAVIHIIEQYQKRFDDIVAETERDVQRKLAAESIHTRLELKRKLGVPLARRINSVYDYC